MDVPCRSFTFTWIAKHTNRSKVIEESLVYINAGLPLLTHGFPMCVSTEEGETKTAKVCRQHGARGA